MDDIASDLANLVVEVMLKQRTDPLLKELPQYIPCRTIYISNLNEKLSHGDTKRILTNHFSQFGEIICFKMFKSFWRRGQAYLTFSTLESAEAAVKASDKVNLNYHHIRVAFAAEESKIESASENLGCDNIKNSNTVKTPKKPRRIVEYEESLREKVVNLVNQAKLKTTGQEKIIINEIQPQVKNTRSLEVNDEPAPKKIKTKADNTILVKDVDDFQKIEDLVNDITGFVKIRSLEAKAVALIDFIDSESASTAFSELMKHYDNVSYIE